MRSWLKASEDRDCRSRLGAVGSELKSKSYGYARYSVQESFHSLMGLLEERWYHESLRSRPFVMITKDVGVFYFLCPQVTLRHRFILWRIYNVNAEKEELFILFRIISIWDIDVVNDLRFRP